RRAGALEPRNAGRGVRIAGVGDDRAQVAEVAALSAQLHRRGHDARAREARGARRLRRVGDEQADVERAALLQAGRDAGRAEAGRQPAVQLRDVVGLRYPARAEETGRHQAIPAPSGKPNIRLRFCTACEEVPFQRLSIAASTTTRPSWRSPWT